MLIRMFYLKSFPKKYFIIAFLLLILLLIIVNYYILHCSVEFKKLVNYIDIAYLYENDRTPNITLFEIFFGSIIRKDQYELYNNIVQQIDKIDERHYNVYNMLMGSGKTDVIIPLLVLKYIFAN